MGIRVSEERGIQPRVLFLPKPESRFPNPDFRLTIRIEMNTMFRLSGFPATLAGLRHAVLSIASKDAPIV